MIKYLIIIVLLFSCTKEIEPQPLATDCGHAYLISDKFQADSSFIRTDTLWHDYICGYELERIMAIKPYWFEHCADYPDGLKIECLRYEIVSPE